MLLTFGEVARRLGVEVNVVRRWVRAERCPVVREGRRARIPATWVDTQPDAERGALMHENAAPEGWAAC